MSKTKNNQAVVPNAKQNVVQSIKFTLISISAGIIQTLAFTLLNEIVKLEYKWSYLIALVLSVLWNFTINRRYTFKSAANVPVAMLKVALFYLVFTPLSTWWGDALTKIGINEYIILIGTMVINLVLEFLYCRLVVYRGKMYTNDLGQKEMAELSQGEDSAPCEEASEEVPAKENSNEEA